MRLNLENLENVTKHDSIAALTAYMLYFIELFDH